jgi:hypothetical protein
VNAGLPQNLSELVKCVSFDLPNDLKSVQIPNVGRPPSSWRQCGRVRLEVDGHHFAKAEVGLL